MRDATQIQMEIVCELAEHLLNGRFKGKIYEEDEDGNTSYTEAAQKEYDMLYDELDGNVYVLCTKDKSSLIIEKSVLESYSYEKMKEGLPPHKYIGFVDNETLSNGGLVLELN